MAKIKGGREWVGLREHDPSEYDTLGTGREYKGRRRTGRLGRKWERGAKGLCIIETITKRTSWEGGQLLFLLACSIAHTHTGFIDSSPPRTKQTHPDSEPDARASCRPLYIDVDGKVFHPILPHPV